MREFRFITPLWTFFPNKVSLSLSLSLSLSVSLLLSLLLSLSLFLLSPSLFSRSLALSLSLARPQDKGDFDCAPPCNTGARRSAPRLP